MKFFVLTIILSAVANLAYAAGKAETAVRKVTASNMRKPASGDAAWLLCRAEKGGDIHDTFVPVVSIYEHRNGADKRKTEVTVLSGGAVLIGSFDNTSSEQGLINLKSVSSKSVFQGTVAVDYAKNSVSLKGKFKGDKEAFDFVLPCADLN